MGHGLVQKGGHQTPVHHTFVTLVILLWGKGTYRLSILEGKGKLQTNGILLPTGKTSIIILQSVQRKHPLKTS